MMEYHNMIYHMLNTIKHVPPSYWISVIKSIYNKFIVSQKISKAPKEKLKLDDRYADTKTDLTEKDRHKRLTSAKQALETNKKTRIVIDEDIAVDNQDNYDQASSQRKI